MDENEEIGILESVKEIFANVNHWLEFAEAKLAGLAALNIALIISLMDGWSLSDLENLILFLIIISTIICFCAFLPKSKIDGKLFGIKIFGEKKDVANLLYFKDIASYEKNEYVEALKNEYFQTCIQDKIVLDYIEEIWINARIAQYKYIMFTLALRIDLIALIFSALLIICG